MRIRKLMGQEVARVILGSLNRPAHAGRIPVVLQRGTKSHIRSAHHGLEMHVQAATIHGIKA